MLSLNLLGRGESNVKYYSDIDPFSLNKLKECLPEGKFSTSDYLVVSKSGRTFETEDGMLQVEKGLINEYKALGNNQEEAQKLADRHFVAVTDAADTSKLRVTAGQKGYLGQFFVHDDVGGRYSALDDHGLFALAYSGLLKAEMVELLEGAVEMTEMSMNHDIKKNPAMQRAAFYVDSVNNGVNDHIHALFGRFFEGGTETWLKQFHGESLKDTRVVPMKCPDGQHYNAESVFDPRNEYSITGTAFDTFGKDGWDNYNTYVHDIVVAAFIKKGPTSLELLEVGEKGVSPRAVGGYIQLKNHETVYKDLLRELSQGKSLPTGAYDAVTQPSVEAYKKSAFNG